ncbi:hypothetical protein INS49_010758 [Diaporthe citri]|uniref:uncharacterized protein n=1 Tax=Diaporthe citri TaxID=83186 RepID=UPI001C7F5A20|nr:uncharacterized protein INS49_010758 [Diaporthe citri]KAG6359706.1 hypothetical protein INS49_010758 [Diaporthe citri]
MKSFPEEIESALASYRKTSAERNKRAIQVYVDAVVNADFEDETTESEFTEDEMNQERIGQLGDVVQDTLDDLTQPTELLDRYDELALKLSLDGTAGGDIDPEERASLAEAYFKALEAALKEKAPDEVKDTISVPEEFRVLAKHNHSEIASRILAPSDIPGKHAVDERVASGWNLGSTVDCDWTCVYAQESDDSWAWKFVWPDQSNSRAFDTIPDLMEWFLEFSESDPPVLGGVTAENVIDRV